MTDLTISGGKLWDAGVRYGFRDDAGWGVDIPLVSAATASKLSAENRRALFDAWNDVRGVGFDGRHELLFSERARRPVAHVVPRVEERSAVLGAELARRRRAHERDVDAPARVVAEAERTPASHSLPPEIVRSVIQPMPSICPWLSCITTSERGAGTGNAPIARSMTTTMGLGGVASFTPRKSAYERIGFCRVYAVLFGAYSN